MITERHRGIYLLRRWSFTRILLGTQVPLIVHQQWSDGALDLPPFLTQPVKAQNPSKGEFSHRVVQKDFYKRVQAGGGATVDGRDHTRRIFTLERSLAPCPLPVSIS